MDYAELHAHSYYSFHDGASSLEELITRARELGYYALALTDHDNLCGAMRFAQLTRSMEVKGLIGAELTLTAGHHLTLLAEDREGYRNLCRLITAAHISGEHNKPELTPGLLPEHAAGLIVLSGCPTGVLSQLVVSSRLSEARDIIRQYLDWFSRDNYYLELQQNLVPGDIEHNVRLGKLARELGIKIVATGNVHYHRREELNTMGSYTCLLSQKSAIIN
jgi:error-prone DNA polymerase